MDIDKADAEVGTSLDFGDGDITITINTGKEEKENVLVKVSSNALCLASPVWKKFIYPPILHVPDEEHKSDARIDFTEDDCEALLILLRIAHLQFHQVPSKLEYSQLLQLAILCDMYDCAKLVRPWCLIGQDPRKRKVLKSDKKTGCLLLGFLGKRMFPKTCRSTCLSQYPSTARIRPVLTTTESKSEDLCGWEYWAINHPLHLSNDIWLNRCIDAIKDARSRHIRTLLDIPNTFALPAGPLDSGAAQVSLCKVAISSNAKNAECSACIYGSFISQLRGLDLWPVRTPDQYTMRLSNLVSQISAIKVLSLGIIYYSSIVDYRGSEVYDSYNHAICSTLGFAKQAKDILEGMRSPILESHQRHLAAARS